MGNVTLLEMFKHGWPILSILIFMSILSVAYMLDRYSYIRKATAPDAKMQSRIFKAVEAGDVDAALALCTNQSTCAARVFQKVLQATPEREHLEKELWCSIQEQIQKLEHNVLYLGTIASTAPFIGLLGTVIGVIRAFMDIATHGAGGFEVVSVGLAESLIATASGLFVAIPSLIAFNYFNSQIQKASVNLEVSGNRLISLILIANQKAP